MVPITACRAGLPQVFRWLAGVGPGAGRGRVQLDRARRQNCRRQHGAKRRHGPACRRSARRHRYRGDDLDGAGSRQKGLGAPAGAADREHGQPDPVAGGARYPELCQVQLGRSADRPLGERLVFAPRRTPTSASRSACSCCPTSSDRTRSRSRWIGRCARPPANGSPPRSPERSRTISKPQFCAAPASSSGPGSRSGRRRVEARRRRQPAGRSPPRGRAGGRCCRRRRKRAGSPHLCQRPRSYRDAPQPCGAISGRLHRPYCRREP